MWRKTRSTYKGNRCVGTDPNRNWDINWSGPGASNVSCVDTYYGPAPESESEVKAVADFVRGNIERIVVKFKKTKIHFYLAYLTQTFSVQIYISVHSFGQLLMYPYFYEPIVTKNNAELVRLLEL